MKITRLTIREYAESLAIAFVLAMIIRHYAVEAFRIPTSSMEPTLIGSEVGGDRILVSKFQYDLHPPQQWDVIVFKIDQHRINYYRAQIRPDDAIPHENGTVTYPGSADYVNYVKRLVGLPGQHIQVKNGDVFINGRISRKPDRVQNVLFVPVTSDELLKRRGVTFFQHWRRHNPGAITRSDGAVVLKGAAFQTECSLEYRPRIEDRVETDQKTTLAREADSRFNVVGDVRLAFHFRHLGGSGYLTGKLSENDTHYAFRLPLGKPGEPATLSCDGTVVRSASAGFDATGEQVLEFSNVDARVTLKVDDEMLIDFDETAPTEILADRIAALDEQTSAAQFGVDRCDVAVRDVRLWRDIFYTSPRIPHDFGVSRPQKLGDDEYFVMGDNSPNSFDSRHWGVIKQPHLIGEAFFVFWPITRWKFIN